MKKKPFLAKNSIKWAKNGQLTLEMALMKDETYVLSIMMQKWDESAKKISKNGPKWEKKILKIYHNLGHWSTLKAC